MISLRPWQTRTHCCRHKCFSFAPAHNICCRRKFCSGHKKMFLILFRNILCPQQMFPNLHSQGNIMSNNVSAAMCPCLPTGTYFLLRYRQTRTHCACCGHIVADTNVSPFARARNICCGHKFCARDKNFSDFSVQKHFVSAANVSQFAQPKKHHEQQCVRNNVSSFASTLNIRL